MIDVDLGGERGVDTREDAEFFTKITEVREALRGIARVGGPTTWIEDR